jgi:RNA polymerase sigma-70 factor (ECF subfamily)
MQHHFNVDGKRGKVCSSRARTEIFWTALILSGINSSIGNDRSLTPQSSKKCGPVTDSNVPPNREGEPSSSLLMRVQAYDQAAWDRLVHLYTPLVCHWCQRANLQPADVQDVGQEVFKAVWRTIHTFRRDHPGDTFRGWLRTITRNKVVDFYRRQRAQVAAPGGGEILTIAYDVPVSQWDDGDTETDHAEASLVYQRAMELIRTTFTEKTWLAFQAYVLEGQKPAEVAKMLEMNVSAVYSAKSRVLKRWHDEFAELLDP